MASLTRLLEQRENVEEQNLVQGQIYSYVNSDLKTFACTGCGFCWSAPAAGTVKIEMWGGGGAGSSVCCCGFSMGGNSGPYGVKTITVDSGDCICGQVATGGQVSFCNSGQGCPACVCWQGADGTNGCLWVGGGKQGPAFCSTSTGGFCCFGALALCSVVGTSADCGTTCNQCANGACCGCLCADCAFDACYLEKPYKIVWWCSGGQPMCAVTNYQPTPAGLYSKCGSYIVWSHWYESFVNSTFMTSSGWWQPMNMLNKLSRMPKGGGYYGYCWGGGQACGCYCNMCCPEFLPVGMGGSGSVTGTDCATAGKRGGPSGVRLTFIAS